MMEKGSSFSQGPPFPRRGKEPKGHLFKQCPPRTPTLLNSAPPLRPHCLIKLLGRWRSEASLPPLTPWLCQPRRGLRPHRVSRCTPPEGGAFAPTSGCGEVEKRSFSSSPNPLPLWGSPEGAQSPHRVSRWPPRSPHRVSRWGLGKAQGV
jgi:hypothetical protein